MPSQWKMLALISITGLFAMTTWFSVSAVAPELSVRFGLSNGEMSALVIAVQLGFVAGTLFIAMTNLVDVFNPRLVIALASVLAAVFNLLYIFFGENLSVGLLLRFLTGFGLAGVYPPCMKVITSWFKERRGAAIGIFVGAITIGSAMPHWLGALLRQDWQMAISASSVLSGLASLAIFFLVKDGPYHLPASKFNLKYVYTVMKYRPTRLAYLGYFGHMWELYAMWTWIPIFLIEVLAKNDEPFYFTSGTMTFLIIAIGAVGCVVYGFWADKIGRSKSTITSLFLSGLCCFSVGFFINLNPLLLLGICLFWGFVVVADSAQFSAAVSELCEPEYMGTALTLQTSVGFLITILSIHLVPIIKDLAGWGSAFAILGLGPIVGSLAMTLLYKSPEAVKMASGNR